MQQQSIIIQRSISLHDPSVKMLWEMLKAKYGRKKLVGLVAIINFEDTMMFFINKHVDSK